MHCAGNRVAALALDSMTDGEGRTKTAFRTEETGTTDGSWAQVQCWKWLLKEILFFFICLFLHAQHTISLNRDNTHMYSSLHVNMLFPWYVLQWVDNSCSANKEYTTVNQLASAVKNSLWSASLEWQRKYVQQTLPHTWTSEESVAVWQGAT